MHNDKRTNFPKDFLWGASTSSHQVEGNTENQWSAWEKAHAEQLAQDAQKRLAHLYTLGKPPSWESLALDATDPANYISGTGVNHYERYKEDISLLRSLNMNAFRFSIEWSRLEPQENQWDEDAIEHYRAYIAELKRQHIEPVLTLWHWTIPIWFADKGGFAKKQNLSHFYRYVDKVAEEFGTELQYVLILNEPNVYTLAGYVVGFWPPEQKNLLTAFQVFHNLALAHNHAYKRLKNIAPTVQVGSAIALAQTYAHNAHNPLNKLSVYIKDYMWNWWFLNRTRHHLDFIGVNFYSADYLDWRLRQKNPERPHSDLGWYMEPGALYDLLLQVDQKYHLPTVITENGLADENDTYRKWWIEQTLTAMDKALASGVRLKGYLHWSLIDNFEWAYGWWPKFGLVEVDRITGKRKVRKSAEWFAKQIRGITK